MKKIYCLVAITILMMLGCGKSIFHGSAIDILKSLLNPSRVVAASVFAYDSANNNLGLVLRIDAYSLVILTPGPSGYIYNINWRGQDTPTATMLHYSGAGCTGTTYVSMSDGVKGTIVYFDNFHGTLLTATTVNADGTATINPTTYLSSLMGATCNDEVGPPYPIMDLIELSPITRADMGLPAAITPPIQIVSQ